MTAGSCATRTREPRQVGNQAAISGHSCVPRGCPAIAGCKIPRIRVIRGKVYGFFIYIKKKFFGAENDISSVIPHFQAADL